MIRVAGTLRALIEEADELEKDGIIRTERKNLGADIVRIHYPVSAIPQLCRRVGIEDSRIRQIRCIKTAEKWACGAEGTFLSPYYEMLTGRLRSGQVVKKPDMEDEDFFRCLNRIVLLKSPVWRRQFSAEVLHDSKLFEKKYQNRIVTVLEEYSSLSEEGMSTDDNLRGHRIRTYSQTLEWKGPLICRISNGSLIDSSANIFGTMINAQTMECAVPVGTLEIRRIMLIENKANYEFMDFRADTLYIYCHGFFSPKELKPYRMDPAAYETAIAEGAGIPLKKEKKEKLQKLEADELDGLKNCILETGVEIEQEALLLQNIGKNLLF